MHGILNFFCKNLTEILCDMTLVKCD